MANINYEYATQLEQNEQKWDFRKQKLQDVVVFFTCNTFLQLAAFHIQEEAYELLSFIDKGERSDYFASQIDSYMENFEQFKTTFERSCIAEALEKFANKVSNQLKVK